MEIKVEVSDYLSEDEIKEIVISEYKDLIRSGLVLDDKTKNIKNYERVIYNAISQYLNNEIDSIIGTNTKELIESKVNKVLKKEDYNYSIFRQKGVYDKEDSIGYTFLQDAIVGNKDLIIDKVKQRMSLLDDNYFDDIVEQLVYEVIKDKITK